MKKLAKSIAAGALSVLANSAAAQDAPALTIDKVADDLALPLGFDRFYFNRGVNVALREFCEKDAQADIIHCTVDKRSLLSLLVDSHTDTYKIVDGVLSVETEQGGSREWRNSDSRVWDSQRANAVVVDLANTPLAGALIEEGLKTTQEAKLPQNEIFAIGKGGASATLSSLAGVNGQRAFSMGVEFNVGSGITSASSMTQVYYGGALIKGEEINVSRSFSSGDLKLYNRYKAVDTDFGLRR